MATIGKISVYKRGLCYSNVLATGTKDFVSLANEALVGTLMAIGDANDIFPICSKV